MSLLPHDYHRHEADVDTDGLVELITPLSWISAEQRSLLINFIQDAARASACSMVAQKRFNDLIVPRAIRSPSLLKCLLAWSVGHKSLQTTLPEEKAKLEILQGELVQSSLQSLQFEIRDPLRTNNVALIAASLMLCLQKLLQDTLESKSWRIHLEGAKGIMLGVNLSSYKDADDLEILKMMSRWYQTIEALASLTARNLPTVSTPFNESSPLTKISSLEGEYIDEYCGYAFKLNEVLREIGADAWERRKASQDAGHHVHLSFEDFEIEANSLEDSVRSMMYLSSSCPPSFYPGVAEHLSQDEIRDFVLCNEAYQHMALIHIQRRVRKFPSSHPMVQESVKRILDCGAFSIRKSKSSPWIALTAPFFAAGCDALGPDRERIKGLLQELYNATNSESVLRAIDILQTFWGDDLASDYYDWEMLPGNQDMDFIPY